ncbi:DCD domain-containing protein [Forsythia ovata]|uniref:DCD domain-containing protein n=1 Tax=Forsythia ovata TaxID=205694 RepID=A0ABD1RKF9_9LAMI
MGRKGKKKASTSNKTLNENEAAQDALVETENSYSMIVNMEQTKCVVHSENKETTSIDVTKNEEDEETKHEEGNVIMVDNSVESAIKKEMNVHNLTEKDQKSKKTLEDDEDNQERNGHNLTEDYQESEKIPEDDEDNEEGPVEEDDEDSQEDSMEEDEDEEETSEEENEENDTFEDEDSEGDATEEEDDDNEKNAKEEKEIAEGDSGEAEECNEENMGALRKKKVEKLGERSRKKVEENSIDNDEHSEEDRMKEEDDNGAKEDKKIGEGDGQNAEERNAEKLETSSKEKVKKSRQRSRKKKVEGGSSKKVASGAEDKPESSTKKKSKKRVESMGMIFMCSSQTKNDCYHYRVLGLPASKRDLVKKIYKGMRLFLYDVDLKLMYGIYKAAGPGGYNIEPKAFKSQFPSQVRFTVFEDCLPLAEEKFKKVIKDNYFTKNKFDCQLTSSQVKKLCELFVPARKVNHGKKVGRMGKAENRTPLRRERKRRLRGDDETPMLRERNRRRIGDDETPMLRERNRRRRGDDERHSVLRDERWHHERPRKRRRDAVTSPVAPQWQPPLLSAPAPQPLIVPSYAYSRTPEVTVYRLDPYLDDRDPYRRARDPFFDRRDPYREVLDPYVEHHDSSRDGRRLAPQDTFRREPISEHPDVYSHDRLVEYRDSYRRDELLEYRDLRSSNLETRRRDEIVSRDPYVSYGDRSSNLETRRRDEIVSRDPYVSYQDRQSYVDRLYSAEHHSRTGLLPEYRPVAPITDNLSTRVPLPDYRYRGTLSRY